MAPLSPWMDEVRDRVTTRLSAFLAAKREETVRMSPDSVELVDAIADLTMRGGKRVRPMVLAAAYRAVSPTPDAAATDDPGAALELLQSYLLIHDDWMDLDDERRGGPSVYAALRRSHGDDHLGASLAVLAGDLASAYACEILSRAPFPAVRLPDALDAFWYMQREVFFGQHLDMVGSHDVDRVYDLKTGSYTARGPARLGAILGDATPAQLGALDTFCAPIGVAFQVRDELLGTFGDASSMGKPTGSDLRAGKRTHVIAEAKRRLSAGQFEAISKVLGRKDASDGDIANATELLVTCGARRAVEDRLAQLCDRADAALSNAPFRTEELRAVMTLLTHRDR